MPGPLRLEKFEEPAPSIAAVDAPEIDATEEARLAAFEQGYKAGWDDAAAAQDEDQRRLSADVGRNLQELSFTYHEARSHLLRGLVPLIHQICERVVPEVARQAVGEIVVAELLPLAEAAASRPVTIVLNPASRPAVESALAAGHAPPCKILDEPSLGEGLIYLRLDDTEVQIDLDEATAAIGAAVQAHFNIAEEMKEHG